MANIVGIPPLNEKLLNCVLEHIEREVDLDSGRYNQNTWAEINWLLVDKAIREGEETQVTQTMCGSAGCVAGWACMLSTPLQEWKKVMQCDRPYDFLNEAQRKLGLTNHEGSFLFGGTEVRVRRAQLDQIKGRVRVIRESRASGKPICDHPDYEDYER